ncbi:MAG: hypothetical protein FWD82_04355 [Defluviitaleaceae bacterium]|nr:hypothetical protein [Defluviitaleaceae bacterium]
MNKIIDYIVENQRISYEMLRLIASENLPGIDERLPFMMDMFARYVFIGNDNWKYPNYFLDEIEKKTVAMFCELLNCKYVSLKPISGLSGMLTTIASFSRVGDIVMSLHPNSGGHADTSAIINKLGLRQEYLPFNNETWKIDLEELKNHEMLNEISLVYIDLCMVTFHQPISELKKVEKKIS